MNKRKLTQKELVQGAENLQVSDINKLEELAAGFEVKILKQHVGFFPALKKALERTDFSCRSRGLEIVPVWEPRESGDFNRDSVVEVYQFNSNGTKTLHSIGVRK